VSIKPVSELLLPHTVVTGFMPSPSLYAVSVWMINPFAWQWVFGWGATFAFHTRAFVALRLMPAVARMPSFCKRAPSRIARHQALNDVVARAFVSAGVPVTKEPVGFARQDGKRPEGLTLIPRQRGKPLTWDVTVAHTLADSYA